VWHYAREIKERLEVEGNGLVGWVGNRCGWGGGRTGGGWVNGVEGRWKGVVRATKLRGRRGQ